MASPDFYVRGINDAEARGPFSQEQLASLAETGGVTPETYYYDATSEQWLVIGGNAALKAALWPEKKKLGFKQVKWIAAIEFVESFAHLGAGRGGYNEDQEFYGYRMPI